MGKGGMPESVKGVMGWTLGVGIIAFILLIMVIIFGNLSGNVGFTQDSVILSVTNETGALNETGYTLAEVNSSNSGYTMTAVWANVSLTPYLVPAENYTVSTEGILTNATVIPNATEYNDANVSYTFTFSFDSQGQLDSEAIIGNYTESAVNTSAQFPTVGTIIGIAILLAVLISLLVFAIRRMMGVANATDGNSNASFGSDRGFG